MKSSVGLNRAKANKDLAEDHNKKNPSRSHTPPPRRSCGTPPSTPRQTTRLPRTALEQDSSQQQQSDDKSERGSGHPSTAGVEGAIAQAVVASGSGHPSTTEAPQPEGNKTGLSPDALLEKCWTR